MKLNCGPSWQERAQAKRLARLQWHRWFAWYPVRVGKSDCRWMEVVERKGEYHCCWDHCWWEWEYRLPVLAEGEEA